MPNSKVLAIKTGCKAASMGLKCRDAGLVFIWPYFENLFREFGLLSVEGRWRKGEQATRKAVQLLSYILGPEALTAIDCVTIRLLIGQHSDNTEEKVIDAQREIKEQMKSKSQPQSELTATEETLNLPEQAERERCELLMREIVHQWKSIRNLPNLGLQRFFLQREGTWSRDSNDFYLTLTPQKQDFHLSSLPWKVECLRFPWCDYRIFVRWGSS